MESIGRIILLPKGTYNANTRYSHLDWVRHNGKAWVCKQDNVIGITPTEGDTWTVLAEDGEDATAHGIPTGGTAGQVLAKNSNTDYDVAWVNQSGGGSDDEQLIRDTVGWTGKNLLPYPVGTRQVIASDGTITDNSSMYLSDYIEIDAKDVTFSVGSKTGEVYCRLAFYTDAKVFISRLSDGTFPYTSTTPNNAKYVRVCFEDDTAYVTNPMLRRASVTDSTYEPYHLPVTDYTHEAVADGIGWGNKNLITGTFVSDTKNGITFTANDDGTVNANGTASADSYISCSEFLVKKGSYIVNGVVGGSASTYFFDFSKKSDGTVLAKVTDGDVGVTLSEDTVVKVWLNVKSGQVLSNVVFKPMLRSADIVDATYEPYHPTVKQTLRDAEVIEGKNLYPVDMQSTTANGITFTVGADDVVTANGTASAVTVLNNSEVTVPAGKYIMSGCPANGSDSTYRLTVNKVVGGSEVGLTHDYGEGVTLTLTEQTTLKAYPRIASGYTASNLVFKVMLRLATETDDTYEPYYTPLKDGKFDREEQRVLGAKNLLPNTNGTEAVTGVTFTVNTDNSVSVSGTPDSGTNPRYEITHMSLPVGKYIISGDDKSISPISYGFIGVLKNNTGSYVCGTEGSGVTDILEVTNTMDVYYFYIRMANGKTYSNTFKPMIRLASDPDDTYVPYAMTNKELTDGLANVGSPAWSAITSKPFNDVNTSTGGLTITSGSLNANVKSVSVGTTGTAGSTTVKKQQVTINGSATDLIGAAYMLQTVTLLSSQETSVTFTNAIITTTSLIDIFIDQPIPYKLATTTNGTCTIVFSKQDSDTSVTVAIQIINAL